MSPATPAPRHRLALLLLVLLASWPYFAVLDLWPMATDTGLWLERSDPASQGWVEWVFSKQHFGVGYRPVTGLSFTLNAWIDAHSTYVLRGTDILLHVVLALLVATLARQLAPELGAKAGLCAAALYLLHPALEEVVPFGARRSYSLAGVFAIGALALACRVARAEGGTRRRALVSLPVGILLALGLLSNEVAGVALGALPLLVFAAHRPGRGRLVGTLAACLLPALCVGAALYARHGVVGGLGGYRIADDVGQRFGAILLRAWRDTLGPGYASGWLAGTAVSLVAAGCLLVGHVGALSAQARARRSTRLLRCAALGVWLVTYGVLFAEQGVWFPRQGFPIVVPFALLGGLHLAQVLEARRGRAPLLALLLIGSAPLLYTSPVLTGADAERRDKWALRQKLIDGMLAAADAVEDGGRIKAVLPFRYPLDQELKANVARKKLPRDARQPLLWVQYLLRGRATDIVEFLYVEEPTWEWTTPSEVTTDTLGKPAVRMPEGRVTLVSQGRSARLRKPGAGVVQRVQLDALELRRRVYVFLYDAQGGSWALVHEPH